MIVSFNEMHEFYIYEFQDIFSDALCYYITSCTVSVVLFL
jgi:hypothetical protein